MQLEQYYSATGPDQQSIQFTRQQASDFAKQIANDFNPIHDVDAKRFCVPGDLLFSVALSKLGLSQRMHIEFSGMVGDGVDISFIQGEAGHVEVQNAQEKCYLSIDSSGARSNEMGQILALVEEYVAFSGRTFPHILVPLWKSQNAMVNPDRPMVIYQSMSIELDTLEFDRLQLEVGDCELEVNGKRGKAILRFDFIHDGQKIGAGEKHMVLSGLREYDQAAIDGLVEFYGQRKHDYLSSLGKPV